MKSLWQEYIIIIKMTINQSSCKWNDKVGPFSSKLLLQAKILHLICKVMSFARSLQPSYFSFCIPKETLALFYSIYVVSKLVNVKSLCSKPFAFKLLLKCNSSQFLESKTFRYYYNAIFYTYLHVRIEIITLNYSYIQEL